MTSLNEDSLQFFLHMRRHGRLLAFSSQVLPRVTSAAFTWIGKRDKLTTRMLCSYSYETGSAAMSEDNCYCSESAGEEPHNVWRWGRADLMQGNLDFTPRQLLVNQLLTSTIIDTHRIDPWLWKTLRFTGFGYCRDQLCVTLEIEPPCQCSY